MSSSGAIAESFTYDTVGQLTSDSRANYTYSPLGRLVTAMGPGIAASYTYDAAGTRLAKTVNGQTTYTVRSATGDVLSEYAAPCSAPVWTRDIIYAAGRPLGAIRSTAAQPAVSVTATTASVGEAGGSLNVSFTLTTPGGGTLACGVTAAYHTVGGTAASGADYGELSGTVTFTAGSANNTTQTISLSILTDTLDEADETVFVDLTSVIGGAVGTNGRTTVTITDDDPLPALSITDVSVTEGQSGTTTATFTVSLSTTSGRDVQFTHATANATALSGVDYQPASATATIPAGETSYQVAVTVLGDLIAEPTEQFVVNLSNPVNATIADAQGAGTITDDDPVTVSLSANRTFPMQAGNTVIWTANASGATAPYEYQFRLYSATLDAWRIVQDYSSDATFVWTPALGANYSVQVYVRSAGTGNDHDAEATSATFTITAAPAVVLTGFSPSVSFPVPAGTAVTWTATATGGSVPLQYEFWIYDPWPNTWSVLRGYEASNQITWTPTHPGDYAFQVWVRAPGSTAAYDAFTGTGSVTVTGVSPTLLSLTSNRLLPLAPGTTVTWTATAAGGTTPLEYSFLLYRGSTNSWTTERAYSSANTWTWTASTADTYAVQVWARAQGSPAPYDTWTGTGNFTVVSGAITNLALTTTQTFPLAPQAPITWTALASGGTAALQYQFYLYNSATASWDVVQDWSTTNTWTWTPALGDFGVRAVQVWIRSTGSGAPYEAYLGTGYFGIVP